MTIQRAPSSANRAAPTDSDSADLLQLALDASHDGLVDHDLVAGRCVYSTRWLAMLGFESEMESPEASVHGWLELVHSDDREEVEMLWREHLDAFWPFHHTFRMRFRLGGWRWMLCRSEVLRRGERPVRAVSLFTDVTEQVESEQRQQALLAAMPDSMLRLRRDGTVQDWHRGREGQFELLFAASWVPGVGIDAFCLSESMRRALVEAGTEALEAHTSVGRDLAVGEGVGQRYYELRVAPSGHEEFVCVLRDATAHKQLESRLLQKQNLEAIGGLAAGVAHEINTPLQYVSDNVGFLGGVVEKLSLHAEFAESQARLASDAGGRVVDDHAKRLRVAYLRREAPKALAQCLEGIARVSTVVRALKTFSSAGHDGPISADINDAVETIVAVSAGEWRPVASIELALSADLPRVVCAVGEVQQALLQVVVNAAQAIHARYAGSALGRVVVATRAVDEGVEISVSDDGEGIAPDIAPRIFEPFFTTRPVGSGMGNGLALARTVVERAHGGRLTFETQHGVGTTFRMWLPLTPSVSESRVPGGRAVG